jgi:HK97 gp10 family phage protein
MSKEFTLGQFIVHFSGNSNKITHNIHKIVIKGTKLVEKEAKNLIGKHHPEWTDLSDVTKERRAQLGFPADEPELMTGALRDSIRSRVKGLKGHIGSNSQIAVYQEFGTDKMPPRPILSLALRRKRKTIRTMVGKDLIAAITKGVI